MDFVELNKPLYRRRLIKTVKQFKIADMHCDTITELYDKRKKGSHESLACNSMHIDMNKLRSGNYLLQNFAVFQSLEKHKDLFKDSICYIDYFYEEMENNKEFIMPVTSYEDIIQAQREHKIAAMLTLEEGGQAEGKLEYLRTFYRLGVRMIALNWNFENGIGHPNVKYKNGTTLDKVCRNTTDGLTKFGIEFVKEMERLGMVIDVSHSSDAVFYDVLKYTKKPFVASHSNAAFCTNHGRNLTDDMIRQLAERNGVMGINFYPYFIDDTYQKTKKEPYTSIDAIINHMEHIINIGGIASVAIGTDFDGIDGNLEIKDASAMPVLVERLLSLGWKESDIEAICYKNVLRVYKEVLKG